MKAQTFTAYELQLVVLYAKNALSPDEDTDLLRTLIKLDDEYLEDLQQMRGK
jgi:hypothetical protein